MEELIETAAQVKLEHLKMLQKSDEIISALVEHIRKQEE